MTAKKTAIAPRSKRKRPNQRSSPKKKGYPRTKSIRGQPTKRQRQIYDFIVDFMSRNQRPPEYREIARHFKMRSSNGPFGLVKKLVWHGLLKFAKSTRGHKIQVPGMMAKLVKVEESGK